MQTAACFATRLFAATACVAETVHVAPTGSDANPGTQSKPFATLERARDEVRSLKTRNAQSTIRDGVTVFLHGGTYRITKPIVFTPEDSGTKECPIVYAAYRDDAANPRGASAPMAKRQRRRPQLGSVGTGR